MLSRTARNGAFSLHARLLSLGLFVFSAACGASSSAPVQNADGTISETSTESDAPTFAADTPEKLELPAGQRSRISYIAYNLDNTLHLGTSDGQVASLAVLSRKAEVDKPAAGFEVISISPDGRYLVIRTSPGRVVDRKGVLALNMNVIPTIESASFAPDMFSLYVSEAGGKLRIWGQAEAFVKQGDDENLAAYLNRQGSDFNVEFEPLSGPMAALPQGALIMAAADGVISFWSSSAPGRTRQVMKLDGPIKALSASGNDIVAVSRGGALKVGKLEPATYQAWSKNARADWAATNEHLRGQFVEMSSGTLKLRNTESGDIEWEKPLPAGPTCGLSVSPDGRMGAACVDGVILVFYVKDGTWDSRAWFGDTFKWMDARGPEIK